MPLISVVLSFRNEASLLPELIARLTTTLGTTDCDWELLFVNDASTDGSLEVLRAHAAADPRIRVITMSRRFGPPECVRAGLEHASGDAAIFMDTDLQDPPELLPQLISRWRQGAEVVHTVRTRRHAESAVKMAMTRLAYRLIRGVSDIDLRVEAGDFKLLSRRAIDTLLQLDERDPYLRGLAVWIGFRQEYVPYERQPRAAGVTHFPFFSANPWRTVLSGLTSFSVAPLLVWAPLGAVLLLAGLAAGAWVALTDGAAWRWLGVGLLLLSGTHLIALGVIGLYLARVYRDVRRRPHYVVEDTIGWPDKRPTRADRP